MFSLIVLAGLLYFTPSAAPAEDIPQAVSDREFWRMVSDFSEAGGVFQQEFMSNEDSSQFVIPALKQTTRRGGIYIGVGPEQNFTYIAAIEPRLAFIVDIRRDNMIEHLMYKALFEISSGRAEFLSRLFSRKRPPGLDANSSVKELFDAYQSAGIDAALYEENLRAVVNNLVNDHQFPVTEQDRAVLSRFMNAFQAAGPYRLTGSGDKNMSYAQSMTGTDLTGRAESYLASEDNFRKVQKLERQNLVIPVVGDFAGDKALPSIGRYLEERGAIVDVFYVSNVERYLFEQGDHGRRFYANAVALPLDASSTFIRSVTSDISRRLGVPLPDGTANWRSFLSPMRISLKAFEDGGIRSYRELFEIVR